MSTNDIGRRIRQLRAIRHLTLEQVGDRVGVGKSTVRKWETGEIANMRRDKIAKLANALHTSPAYLMGWTDDPALNCEVATATDISTSTMQDPLQNPEVLFALFGGADDITPDMVADVRRFAHFVRQQKRQSNE